MMTILHFRNITFLGLRLPLSENKNEILLNRSNISNFSFCYLVDGYSVHLSAFVFTLMIYICKMLMNEGVEMTYDAYYLILIQYNINI